MRIAFRVDANEAIGSGHLMRCQTLADALRLTGAETRFVCRGLPDALRVRLSDAGHGLVEMPPVRGRQPGAGVPSGTRSDPSEETDAGETNAALSDQLWDWLIVDHYGLSARWESALRDRAHRSLVIDDLADREHDCDLLLDQNLYADMQARYRGRVPGRCHLLLGPQFALLRDEFRRWRRQVVPRSGPVARVLVAFGGFDSANDTSRAIDALAALPTRDLVVDVVIGREHPDRVAIESACVARGFACHVQTARMAELMAAADLAIGAGGTTTWERCCLGLPALVRVVAQNQRQQVRDAAAAGLICAPDEAGDGAVTALLGRHVRALIENSGLRHSISARGMAVVDGRGVVRVIRHMGFDGLDVREARPEDCVNLFEWRNHPTIREASRRHEPIDWESHQQWFAAVQADPQRKLLIGHRAGISVGVVRFDIEGDEAEVSIYLVPVGDTAGFGGALLHAAERWLASTRPDLQRCRAHVLGPNTVSHRLFHGAGYAVESTWYYKKFAHP